jgi:hypothetical protein
MIDSMMKDICDSWVDIRNKYCGVSTDVGLRMMTAMLDVSGMCG